MTGKFSIDDPGKMVATMTISMEVWEWKELLPDIRNNLQNMALRNLIKDLLKKAAKEIYAEDPE